MLREVIEKGLCIREHAGQKKSTCTFGDVCAPTYRVRAERRGPRTCSKCTESQNQAMRFGLQQYIIAAAQPFPISRSVHS